MDAIETFATHVVDTRYEDLPAEAVAAAKMFLLDTLGVGIAGSAGPFARELIETQSAAGGEGDRARVWGSGDRLTAAGAAMCNAYQIHNSEFDCVHEAAVVHTMTVLTATAMAHAERAPAVDGKQLLAALVLGVDVACHIAVASRAPLRFFRPATAGAFAATAGVGKLMGFDRPTLVNAFGAVHGQLCGTMQAHTEGSILLGMQVGFNARNALLACDLAARGLVAPHEVLEGEFGYFALFEGEHDIEAALKDLGKVWRITEVAHKPFPSGRATHGIIDAGLALANGDVFEWQEIDAITARVPPLVQHLVGRPIKAKMELNYARLCAQFVLARALQRQGLTVEDFKPDALADATTQALGQRIKLVVDDNPDPNALSPVTVEIRLTSGQRVERTVEVVYGNPARPMSRTAQLQKLATNWKAAPEPLPEANREALVAAIDALEDCPDVAHLVDYLVPA